LNKQITGRVFGGRTRLADKLPLSAPYIVNVFPLYVCNLACRFCLQSLPDDARPFVTDKVSMDFGLYKKIVDDLNSFPVKVKSMYFAGWGEPLLHKNITDMIAYARETGAAERVNILTNGTVLTPALSESLVNAGLTLLRISINGLSAAEYEENCNRKVNFQEMLDNIGHLFSIRKETKVYIKILDYMVDTEERKARFYALFEPICDMIQIEYVTPTGIGVDIEHLRNGQKLTNTIVGEEYIERSVCPNSFFETCINPDGKVVPCAYFPYPRILADLNREKLSDVWTGRAYNSFRRDMLKGARASGNSICAECRLFNYRNAVEDFLDDDAHKLKELYQ
jgi:radical SAM protein with 4Fe4S-binding SPASM domain